MKVTDIALSINEKVKLKLLVSGLVKNYMSK